MYKRQIQIRGSDIQLRSSNGSKIYLEATDGAGVDIRHNNLTKLDTTVYGIDVTGTVSADGLTVSGIATLPQTSFTGDVEVQNLKVSGISTLGNIKIESNTLGTQSGNLLLDSFAGTLQTNDVLFVNNVTQSTNKDTGSIITQGGIGVEKNVNIGGNLGVTGTTTLAGIVTTGTDLFVGGNLNVLGLSLIHI